jgi:hypothetical protein
MFGRFSSFGTYSIFSSGVNVSFAKCANAKILKILVRLHHTHDSHPQQNLRWELGLTNKLDILCCWVIFGLIITLLLSLSAFNREIREIGLIIHHTFVDRFYREQVFQKLQ